MRKKIMFFVCVLFLFAGAAALYAEEGGALPAGAVLSFAPEFHESGFRLSAQGGYLWSLGRLRVGGGVAVDYGLRTCDLWVNPFAEAEFFGVLYARAGLAALVYPRVAAESYYTVSGGTYFLQTPFAPYLASGLRLGNFPLGGGRLGFDLRLTISPRPREEEGVNGLAAMGALPELGAGVVYRF